MSARGGEITSVITFRSAGPRFAATSFEVGDGVLTATGAYVTSRLTELEDGSVAVHKVLRGKARRFSWPLSVIAQIEECGDGSPLELAA
jgi:hypothetical protein